MNILMLSMVLQYMIVLWGYKMNEQEKPKLSEERQNEICICDCGYHPLKHFEECPNCRSVAFHVVLNRFTRRMMV